MAGRVEEKGYIDITRICEFAKDHHGWPLDPLVEKRSGTVSYLETYCHADDLRVVPIDVIADFNKMAAFVQCPGCLYAERFEGVINMKRRLPAFLSS